MLPSPRQGSLPVGWLTFTEREFNPLDRVERFPILTSSSSSPVLFLALGGFSPVRLQGWHIRRDLPNTTISLSLLPAYTDRPVVCRRPSCISWSYQQPALSRTCGLDNAPPWRGGNPPPQGPSLGHPNFISLRLIWNALAVRERLGHPRAVPVFR